MPMATLPAVLPDPVLTALAVEFGTGGPYIADLIAPVARVERDSFKFATWGQEEIKLDIKAKRAPGTPASEIELSKAYTAGTVTYRALKSRIPDEIRNNDPSPGSLNARRVKVLTNKLRLEAEDAVATLVESASNTRSAPSTKWDAANPTIRKDIMAAREAFRRQAGMYPNVMVLPPTVKQTVFSDTAILDLIRYTQGSFIATGSIPVIENMQVVVPGAIVDAANPGAALSVADVWEKDEVYYLYVDQTAGDDLEAMTALRQVRSLATGGTAFVARSWRDPDQSANTDWVAVEVNQVELVLSQKFILRQLDVLA